MTIFNGYEIDIEDIFWESVKTKNLWEHFVPETYLKHVKGTDGLYEIRIQQGNDIFRIFCFFDKGKLVVTINGFQKKTNKTPKTEINKALQNRTFLKLKIMLKKYVFLHFKK